MEKGPLGLSPAERFLQGYAPFDSLPQEERTYDLSLEAVARNPMDIAFVPKEHRNEVLCRTAVEGNGLSLFFVPKELRTRRLCETAVQGACEAVRCVPAKIRGCLFERAREDARRLHETLVRRLERGELSLNAIAGPFRTPDLCRAAMKAGGERLYMNIDALPYAFMSEREREDVLVPVLSANPGHVTAVPEKYLTRRIRAAVVEHDSRFFDILPTDERTSGLAALAVGENPLLLGEVPVEGRTEELCRDAVGREPHALRFVPEGLMDEDLCLGAVSGDGSALRYVPKRLRTERVVVRALESRPEALLLVDVNGLLPHVVEVALRGDGLLLKLVPVGLKTRGLCLAALAQNPMALESVDEEMLTEEICRNAVNRCGLALKFVPEAMKTADLCSLAVERTPAASAFVPAKFARPDFGKDEGKGRKAETAEQETPRVLSDPADFGPEADDRVRRIFERNAGVIDNWLNGVITNGFGGCGKYLLCYAGGRERFSLEYAASPTRRIRLSEDEILFDVYTHYNPQRLVLDEDRKKSYRRELAVRLATYLKTGEAPKVVIRYPRIYGEMENDEQGGIGRGNSDS